MQGKIGILRLIVILVGGLIGLVLLAYSLITLLYVYQWPRELVANKEYILERTVLRPWHLLNIPFEYYPKPKKVLINDFGIIVEGNIAYGVVGKVLSPISVSGERTELSIRVVGYGDRRVAIDNSSIFYNIGEVMRLGWITAGEPLKSLTEDKVQPGDWLYLVWMFEKDREGVINNFKLTDWVWEESVDGVVLVAPQERVYRY